MNKTIQFITGLLTGLIFPAIAWFVFDSWLQTTVMNRPALPYFIAIAINLIMLRFMIKRDKELAGYGLIISTFVIAILVFKLKQ